MCYNLIVRLVLSLFDVKIQILMLALADDANGFWIELSDVDEVTVNVYIWERKSVVDDDLDALGPNHG